MTYPFVAEATANDVLFALVAGRYYHCGKLNRGDRVTVVEEAGAGRKPAVAGKFLLISQKLRQTRSAESRHRNGNNGLQRNGAGMAGSDYRTDSLLQHSGQASRRRVVELVDPSQPLTGDYYKIKVPSGGYLWVNSEYLRYVGP